MSKVTNRPNKLYKYEAFTERSLQNLKAQVIFFGSPQNFNDPYDCALKPVITPPSNSEVESIRASFLNQPFSQKAIAKFRTPSTQDLRGLFLRSSEATIKDAQQRFEAHGISCFSEVNDDLLMWSHYGGKYKGFCLEFNTSHPPFEKMRKVSYSNKMPRIDVATLVLKEDFEAIMDLFSTKSTSWAYCSGPVKFKQHIEPGGPGSSQ